MSGSSCTADRKFSSGQPTGSGTTFSYNVTAAGVFLGELPLFFLLYILSPSYWTSFITPQKLILTYRDY